MIGIISGSGINSWPALEDRELRTFRTKYGEVEISMGRFAGEDVAHLTRHGHGHVRLSNHVNHRANIAALDEAGVDAIISLSVCGAVGANLPLGSVVVFDDFYFPSNRLPDGTICTWYETPGDPQRGHWIFEQPFSAELRELLIAAGNDLGLELVGKGCYGHVDGPRFNSRVEIAALHACGVSAISQTAGPEIVLAGELHLPFALIGFITDYANGVVHEPQPASEIAEAIARSSKVLASLVGQTLLKLKSQVIRFSGFVYRFES